MAQAGLYLHGESFETKHCEQKTSLSTMDDAWLLGNVFVCRLSHPNPLWPHPTACMLAGVRVRAFVCSPQASHIIGPPGHNLERV
jgi:hypothetical protein